MTEAEDDAPPLMQIPGFGAKHDYMPNFYRSCSAHNHPYHSFLLLLMVG